MPSSPSLALLMAQAFAKPCSYVQERMKCACGVQPFKGAFIMCSASNRRAVLRAIGMPLASAPPTSHACMLWKRILHVYTYKDFGLCSQIERKLNMARLNTCGHLVCSTKQPFTCTLVPAQESLLVCMHTHMQRCWLKRGPEAPLPTCGAHGDPHGTVRVTSSRNNFVD